ncbi:MAG: hypothetical protein V7L00_08095 [Nostoc sp.]|uniref:hypothetical protein n=1 Tax=unclassified Nostoc TaxID=2593658 RepID=UPI00260086C0|nr:hypothetical protein [Nostoc sp. JL33]MBN3872656.1 hypothetical protein [Nostoc sp. JL33]
MAILDLFRLLGARHEPQATPPIPPGSVVAHEGNPLLYETLRVRGAFRWRSLSQRRKGASHAREGEDRTTSPKSKIQNLKSVLKSLGLSL